MRDLKFRAKVIKPTKPWMNLAPAGSWVVGELHTMSSQPHIHTSLAEKQPIDTSTIGEYTGLNDKYGKDIFEHDILLIKSFDNVLLPLAVPDNLDAVASFSHEDAKGKLLDECKTPVIFREGGFVIFLNGSESMLANLFGDMRYHFPYYEVEVIGNFYDSPPALLKELHLVQKSHGHDF